MRSPMCGRCRRIPRASNHGWCRNCINAYKRVWWKRRGGYAGQTRTARLKASCRAHTRVLVRRGQLRPMTCVCGAENTRARHLNYNSPRAVIWLCPACHKNDQKKAMRIGNA